MARVARITGGMTSLMAMEMASSFLRPPMVRCR